MVVADFTLEDEYDPAWRLPDRFDSLGSSPEDVLLAMRAGLAWDARIFGLCAGSAMIRAKQEGGRHPRIEAAATYWDYVWGRDFVGYAVRRLGFRREDALALIARGLEDARRLADGPVLLVAGPLADDDEAEPICPPLQFFRGEWIRIHFPRVIGSVVSPAAFQADRKED